MNSRKNIVAMLLLSFMIISLNLFSTPVAIYAFAVDQSDAQEVAEQTADTEETEVTTEEGKVTIEEAGAATEPIEETSSEVEESALVAFDESRTVDGVEVRVTADAGVFPEGATLRVGKLKGADKAEAEAAIDNKTGGVDIAKEYLFDITILDKDGNEIQPEGKASVSFETSEVADVTLETNVYHIKDNGKAEALDVDVNGVVAQVETTGFSPYSLIFSYTNPSSETTKSITLPVGGSAEIAAFVSEIGLSQYVHGQVEYAESSDPSIVEVYTLPGFGTWYLKALAPTDNEVRLTLRFEDGYEGEVLVTTHKHHWTAMGDKTDALTISCNDDNCYFNNNPNYGTNSFTAQIIAEDVTYDGQPHGAEQELQHGAKINFPTNAVDVGDIHYVGNDGTTYADSTTEPTDAGKYKAYYQVRPQGQDDVFTVQTTYTINKADIKFDPAPTAVSKLIYNGLDQDLYTLGTAKSATASETFPIKYWYASDSSQKVEDEVLKGKDVDTFKINYQAEGDANHNTTEVKTIEIKIGKRPVRVSGITASNKTYDGTTAATLNFDGAEFENILEGDALTVSAQGAFADRNTGDNKTVNITDMTLGGADADKYTLDTNGQQSSTTANITQKTLKVKWQDSAELPYTGEEQAPEAEFEFAQELSPDDGKAYTGDDVQPVITGKHKDLAKWTASVSLGGGDAGNYRLDPETSNVKMEYQIVPKKLNVEWTTIEKEYDANALEPDYTLDGFVGGDQPNKHIAFTADPTELVGNQAVNAGSYKATLELTGETASNYEITNPETTFTITKAPLSIYAEGWIYYGDKIESKDDIHGIKYVKDKCEGFKGDDGVGVLKGDASFTTDYEYMDDATGVDGAKYNLIAQNVVADNYNITGANGELIVYPKPVELVWSHEHDGTKAAVNGEQAFTYDGKKHTYTAVVKGATDVTVETYKGNTQRDANAKTGTEKYTAEAVKLSNPNYALTDKDGKAIDTKSVDFTIAQLPVNLTWAPAEFTYNGQFQTPAKTIANLQTNEEGVKDEEFGISVKREKTSEVFDEEREESVEAGDWKITAINEESGQLEDANYTLEGGTGLSSEYVIKPLPVELTWTSPQEYTYNAQPQSQIVETNIAEDDQDYIELINEDASATDVGTYTHKITGIEQKGEKNRADNYEFTAKTRSWKINPAPLTVTANNKTITYGQDPANAGVRYSGFQGKDNASVLEGSVSYSYNYARYGKPGNYTITPSGLSAANYEISYKPGTLTVSKKNNTLNIKAKTTKLKYKKLKKKTQKLAVTKVVRFTDKGQGRMAYKLVSAKKGKKSFKKYIKINTTTGKVTIKKNKRMKKGTYKVKVNVRAAGNAEYNASAWKTVTFKIKVK